MRIYPAFEYSTWIGLDDVWGVDVNIKAENESGIDRFQLSRCRAMPCNVLGRPWRAGGRISTCEMSFGRPVGYGRCCFGCSLC